VPDPRCRLCSANDQQGTIELVAEQLWESRRQLEMGDPPWADAGAYWQSLMRELAHTAVRTLSPIHG
jgi:hypothetical protein